MYQFAFLVHLVVILTHSVLRVDGVDEGGVTRRLVVRAARVVERQESEFGDFDAVVSGVREQTVTVCHRMDLRALDFEILQSVVEIDVAFDTPDVGGFTCKLKLVLHWFVEF